MAEKNINSRIMQKHDTEANWKKATNFIPKAGEIVIYDADGTYNAARIKVGNNSSTINELPFISSNDDRIFIAEYGTTTFDDIINAANTDNKSVFCRSADGGIINLAYCHADGARFVGYTLYGEQELYCGPNDEWTVNNINILSTNVTHGEVSLSDILETYILNIDYNTLLAFDTSEIVTGATSTTSVLGQAILGQMVLA